MGAPAMPNRYSDVGRSDANHYRSIQIDYRQTFFWEELISNYSDDFPASLVTGKASGGTSRKFGGVRAEVSRKEPRLLRSCLGVEISRGNPSEANF